MDPSSDPFFYCEIIHLPILPLIRTVNLWNSGVFLGEMYDGNITILLHYKADIILLTGK